MSRESLTVGKGGILHYRYHCTPECGFRFTLLSEVGAPYQQWFRDEIARRGLQVEYGVSLLTYPWCADRVKTQPKNAGTK